MKHAEENTLDTIEGIRDFHARRDGGDPIYSVLSQKLADSRNDGYMNHVWKTIYKRSDDEAGATWRFLFDCVYAYRWEEYERKTPKEKKQEYSESAEIARRLSSMIKRDPVISILASKAIDDSLHELSNTRAFIKMDAVLSKFIENMEDAAVNYPVISKRPNTKNAHQIVFVKRLTASMRERFGMPLYKAVANTACVVFDVEDIDEDFVRSNTRN